MSENLYKQSMAEAYGWASIHLGRHLQKNGIGSFQKAFSSPVFTTAGKIAKYYIAYRAAKKLYETILKRTRRRRHLRQRRT